MADYLELIYLGAFVFITVLFVDFIIIEITLKLNVFAYGNIYSRILLILALELQALGFYLANTNPPEMSAYYSTLGVIGFIIWNPLYYLMLIEQNLYWMSERVKKVLYFGLVLFIIFTILVDVMFLLLIYNLIPLSYFGMTFGFDLCLLSILSITEFFLLYKVYSTSKEKVKRVSLKLWYKVGFCLLICCLCVFLDLAIIIMENCGSPNMAYEVKTCTIAFKIVFECLCFQFIKGIVLSIE